MKHITLLRLALRNFKGIKNFVLEANGQDASVFGDNAVGKTTLFDAFTWVLFDKDSQNKKDFDIKTLDEDNKVIHGLEHEVECVLQIDGRRRTLRKVYTEKWTKKRGSAKEEFTGHTTDHFIDGVPSTKSEFTECVDSIMKEDIFKLLTSPAFFNEQLDWKKRRQILMDVCGDISEAEVISNNKKLSKLPEILGDRSIEDHRKVIVAKRTEINKELEKIPVRIDEARRSIPDIADLSEEFISEDIESLKVKMQDKQAEISRIRSGGEVSVKEKQLREAESELLHIKNQLQSGTVDLISQKQRELAGLQGQYSELNQKASDLRWKIDRNGKRIGELDLQTTQLRQRWASVNAEAFEHHHDENCPTCRQALPQDQLQAAHDKALASFNLSKAERLESISNQGKAAAADIAGMKREIETYRATIESTEAQLQEISDSIAIKRNELNQLQTNVTDVSADPRYLQKQNEIMAIESEIQQLRLSSQEAIEKSKSELQGFQSELDRLEQDRAKFSIAKATEQRIQELAQQEKELAAEYERLEEELFLTEEFIRTKVATIESKINSMFHYARFKLFEQQINGGLAETCETTYRGVPYSSGLNKAAQMNVGLDIINTLSEHYGYAAPIFVDNAEAVTRLIETNTQIIRLVVSAKDKQLRVDQEERIIQEAI